MSKATQKPSAKSQLKRAASYCRTSGEGQRDNTSIPTQDAANRTFIKAQGWVCVGTYVDECKSGASIDGRTDFQRMMKDAAAGNLDVIVPFDISRYGRDGADIIETARTFKRELGVDVVDSKGQFDTRDPGRTLSNFIGAGMAQADRLRILERTIDGRIARAKGGMPWSGKSPVGRSFDRETKTWYVNELGKQIRELLRRYVRGESLAALCREFGIKRRSQVSKWVWHGQLAGQYVVTFDAPEVGKFNIRVEVPGMPEVVSASLLAKVRTRMEHNRNHNRVDVNRYNLSGYVRCHCCGRTLTAQTMRGIVYYRHQREMLPGCTFKSVRANAMEPAVLDYLYHFFMDEPAFNAAVGRAMPSAADRKRFLADKTTAEKRQRKNAIEIERLVKAIREGADPSLLVASQNELRAEKKSIEERINEISADIAALPSVEQTEAAAMVTRLKLMIAYADRDWRKLTYDEIRQFLLHLFGPTIRESKAGIFIAYDDAGRLRVKLKGQVEFYHEIVNGRPVSRSLKKLAAIESEKLRSYFRSSLAQLESRQGHSLDELISVADNKLSVPPATQQ